MYHPLQFNLYLLISLIILKYNVRRICTNNKNQSKFLILIKIKIKNTNLAGMRIYLERVADISTCHPINQTAGRPDFRRGRAQFCDHPTLRHVLRQREPGGDAGSKAGEQLPLPEMYDQVRGDRLRFNAAIGRLDLQLVSGFVIGQFLRSSYHTAVRIDHKLLRVYSLETIHDPRIFPVVVVHRFRAEHEIPFKGNGLFSVAYKRLQLVRVSVVIQVLLNAFRLVFSKDG